jgi:predicted PhzF superfamily epimerase YddE/YHI9
MDYLIEFEDEAMVRALAPDMRLLKSIEARGFIATSRSASPEFDFVSRFFGPGVGIDEDPVTGSSHCCLGPFWAARLGKDELFGHQISARGGVVRVRLAGDRVRLAGQAVTVMRGELV